MDAHSLSCASSARLFSSRIYEDLKILRCHTVQQLQPAPLALSPDSTSSVDSLRRVRSSESKPHIGVIGAGLAGLRCADILLRHGFKVTVLEGRDRVGGRLHQERLPNGYLVDTGPNWIHGTKDNPILDLARHTKTAVGSWDNRSYLFDERGVLLPLEDGEQISTTMWSVIEEAFEYSNKCGHEISPDESLFDFFERRIVHVIPDTAKDCEALREKVLQMAELWGAFVGSPIRQQSLKFFWLEECIEGGKWWVDASVVSHLTASREPALRRNVQEDPRRGGTASGTGRHHTV